MHRNHDIQRFEQAEACRDALRIGNQPPRDPLVTVTKYVDGVEVSRERVVPPPPVELEVE